MSIKRWAANVELENGVMFSRQICVKNLRETYRKSEKTRLKPLEHLVYETVITDVEEELGVSPEDISVVRIRSIGLPFGG